MKHRAVLINLSELTSTQSPRITFLDYLRIFAFLSVLIGHVLFPEMEAAAMDTSIHATVRLLISALIPLVRLGGAGVVVFFLVSGYIITRVLRTESPGEFAIKRFFRIYPLYVAALLAERVLGVHSGYPWNIADLLQKMTLLGDFTDTPYALGGVEWTLRLEIYFYALMGCSTWIAKRFGSSLDRSAPLLFLAITSVLAFSPPLTSGTLGWGTWPATGVITLYFPFLLIGSMVQLREQRTIRSWMLTGFIAVVLCHFYWHTPMYQPLWMGDHHAIIAIGIFIGAWLIRDYLPASPVVRWLSDLTYPIYLFHNWLFFIALHLLIARTGWNVATCTVVSFVILFGVSHLSSIIVEKPFIKIGRRIAQQVK